MDAKGETLEKKIEFLVEKKSLPEMLNDACWIIRKMGNAAAHADDIKVHAYDVDKVIEYVAVMWSVKIFSVKNCTDVTFSF